MIEVQPLGTSAILPNRVLNQHSRCESPPTQIRTKFPTSAAMKALRVAQFLLLGYTNFGARGYRANEAYFTRGALDVDLSGRQYIITGATSGLGRVTATELARRGGSVHLLCRDASRGSTVRDEIVRETGNKEVTLHICDLSRLRDIAAFSLAWIDRGVPIACLINNAGIMVHRVSSSDDGLEMAFATNTLGTFALTEMLRPALELYGNARVVTVSSGGMLTERLEVDDLEGLSLRNDTQIDGSSQYSRTKRHQVALTEYWARKYNKGGIFWASMHPGWAGTPGLEKSMPEFYRFTKDQLRSQEQGADTIVYLAVADNTQVHDSGKFFFDRKPAAKHMWLAGTSYDTSEVDCLVERLRGIITEKGYSLPT